MVEQAAAAAEAIKSHAEKLNKSSTEEDTAGQWRESWIVEEGKRGFWMILIGWLIDCDSQVWGDGTQM